MFNCVTLITTYSELEQFLAYLSTTSLDGRIFKQYFTPDDDSLPAVMGFEHDYPVHQPLDEDTLEDILSDCFSTVSYLPFHVAINPSNYPEFFI